MTLQRPFRIGDDVVIPHCGVGTIDAIEHVDVGSAAVEMYRITASDDVLVWLPTTACAQELRRPVPADTIDTLLAIIRDTEAPAKRANWNRRRRRYADALTTNDPAQMAAVLGELAAVRKDKRLSFGERQLFDKVRRLLAEELACTFGASRTDAALDEALAA